MQNRALGKGLSALIPETSKETNTQSVKCVKTQLINDNSLQPRTHYDAEKMAELMASIKEKGILQPILIREKSGAFEVIAGERRLRAARTLKIQEIPVIIKEATDKEALVLAIVENVQREDLNAIEEAQGFQKLMKDFDFTQDDVAQSVGKDRSTISNIIRLLKLPDEIQRSVANGILSVGHARALLGIENPSELKRAYVYAVSKGLSVREVEKLVKKGFKENASQKTSQPIAVDNDLAFLEEDLQKTLGTKVQIMSKKKKGKIVIEYYSTEDLDRLIDKIKS